MATDQFAVPLLHDTEHNSLRDIIDAIEDDRGFSDLPTTLIESTTSTRILACLIVECTVAGSANYMQAARTACAQLRNCIPAPTPLSGTSRIP